MDVETTTPPDAPDFRRLFGLGALAWIVMLGVDFFLHGGLLARLYAQPHPFLLAPEDAFALIPLGYLSFLLLDILLLWLMVKLEIANWQRGLAFGLALGGFMWGALMLGLLSISTASPALLFGWFAGQSVELGLAGAVMGSGLSGTPLRRILVRVLVLVLILTVVTVAMQNTGLAPAAAR